jgi:hypothetical protein
VIIFCVGHRKVLRMEVAYCDACMMCWIWILTLLVNLGEYIVWYRMGSGHPYLFQRRHMPQARCIYIVINVSIVFLTSRWIRKSSCCMIFRASEVSVSVISKSSFSSCANFLLPYLSEASLGLSAGHPFEFVNMGCNPLLNWKWQMRSMWDGSAIENIQKWHPRETDAEPKWDRCKTEMISKWDWREIETEGCVLHARLPNL